MTAAHQRTPVLLLSLSIAAVGIQALMLSPLLTDIARGLGTGAKEIGFAAGAYGTGVALAALLAAPQLGRWPKREAIRIAFAVLAASLFLAAMAWDWRVLAAAELLTGLATGVIIPATYALTADLAPPERRSQDMGKVLFGWSIAMVMGVPLAALLSAFVGWRGTFATVGVIAAAMPVAGALLPKVPSQGSGDPVRYADVLGLPGAVVGYVVTFAYMICFYQTYTFIGDHVRHLHGAGAWLGGSISLSYGLGFGAGVVFDKMIDRKGPPKVSAGAGAGRHRLLSGAAHRGAEHAGGGGLSGALGACQPLLHDSARLLYRGPVARPPRHGHGLSRSSLMLRWGWRG